MINRIMDGFKIFVDNNNLIEYGDKIVVGLSGGPDSICLLSLLVSIKDEYNLEIVAAHVNHMLRGKAADEDQEFSENICKTLGLKCYSTRVDVNNYCKKNGLSSETAGREIRYNFFDEILRELKYNKIATAHNANDQVETIIMRIMRGTGLEGLCGIPVIRDGKYIRPILNMKREDIERYCDLIGIEPRIDKSNLGRDYSRNKVRLDILPYMKANFNEDVVESIYRMGTLLQEDNNYISNQVDLYFKQLCDKTDNSIIIKKQAYSLESSIYKRIIRRSIRELSGNCYDVEMKHIEAVINLTNHETGKQINLPNNVLALNVYGDIVIKQNGHFEKPKIDEIVLKKSEILHSKVRFNNYTVKFDVIKNTLEIEYNKNSLIKYFDFDEINGNIVIRYRKKGDKINVLGLNGSKKVKDIFIDTKIPKEQRKSIPIVEVDNTIIWVVGIRTSEKYKLRNDTRKVLQISFTEGDTK